VTRGKREERKKHFPLFPRQQMQYEMFRRECCWKGWWVKLSFSKKIEGGEERREGKGNTAAPATIVISKLNNKQPTHRKI
jgi:hypothetical protein